MSGPPQLFVMSGGQTGVDRAALDAATEAGIAFGGWCPKGGWAEDRAEPPGLVGTYPQLEETPSGDLATRTEWNVRDSDATLILFPKYAFARSPGTTFTLEMAEKYGRPHRLLPLDAATALDDAQAFLRGLGPGSVKLNIAGPRESEAPGIYDEARSFLSRLFQTLV